ncbi:hypothetical protein BpHYR1_031628 [Brachionus plicatilis]|uniref:Uncharacterized protein n=1 Tax=Brachionus plicatilis TaxID=10195 RepID=A0A3M7S4N1_BRAPC|nr:hypothetical protein BpHYR1_031628 [Brachionus plicatilis]
MEYSEHHEHDLNKIFLKRCLFSRERCKIGFVEIVCRRVSFQIFLKKNFWYWKLVFFSNFNFCVEKKSFCAERFEIVLNVFVKIFFSISFSKRLWSIFRYHLDLVFVGETKLGQLDIRMFDIKKYARFRPMLGSDLRLETLEQLYMKHKIFFMKQLKNKPREKDTL